MNTFTSPGFIGGFNVRTNGKLELQTAGFPETAASVVVRDRWQHWSVLFNFTNQTFTVGIDGVAVASNVTFLNPFSSMGVGFFDVFGGAGQNDIGYFDNYSVTTVPEPGTLPLLVLAAGMLALVRLRSSAQQRG